MSFLSLGLVLLQALNVAAHGDHSNGHDQIVVADDANWATRHMAGKSQRALSRPPSIISLSTDLFDTTEEHHINSFDAGSFFSLHDFDSTGFWAADDIKKTYGLFDESTAHISPEQKDAVAQTVLDLFDADKSGTISFAEFTVGCARGLELPDFGYGPGHHGDDEYEYEIHHFEKFHSGEDVTVEELTHPEDIEHFRKHELLEEEAERQEKLDRMEIVDANIPQKFRRQG